MTPPDGAATCPRRPALERLARGETVDEAIAMHASSCARCTARLARLRADNDLLAEFVAANADRAAGDAPLTAVAAPTGYTIDCELHRGAQGVVYRAHHAATKRTVALKLLAQGAFATARQRQRFEREVELVAGLRHPGIVTVYDSGRTPDGRPFLAMELVEGETLDVWARTHAGPDAPVGPILDVFIAVAAAVSAAHRRAVMHRDLKPANIIVDDAGTPHVLDFGLAKLLDARHTDVLATVAGEFLGTFAYAAPEQVARDPEGVDTRADVYALGVILYELLAGRRPLALTGGVGAIVQSILEDEPDPLGMHRGDLDPDLAIIVATALAKDPEERYHSVRELLNDLERFRSGRPIEARRHERWYVLRKTLRRHRVPVALGAAAVLVLAGFAVTMTIMNAQVRRASVRREGAMQGFLGIIGTTDQEDPEAPLPATTIVALLNGAASVVDEHLAGSAEDEADARTELGLAYLSRAMFDSAETQLERAAVLRRVQHAGPHADVAQALHNLGRLDWKRGRYGRAEVSYREALGMLRVLHPGDHGDLARTVHHLASTLRRAGRLDEAEDLFRDSLAMRIRLYGEDHPAVANNRHGLGNVLRDRGRAEAALAEYRLALATIEARFGTEAWQAARARHTIATCLIDLGRLDEAETELGHSLDVKRRLRGEEHLDVASGRGELARLRLARNDAAAAEPLARRTLAVRRTALGDEHPDTAESRVLLGRVLVALGRPEEARPEFRDALAVHEAALGATHWRVAANAAELGSCRVACGDDGGLPQLRAATAVLREVLAPESAVRRRAEAALDRIERSRLSG